MTDIQRYDRIGVIGARDCNEWVKAADAEAAIARLAATAVEQILGSDEDMRAAITEAFLEGQRDMLAKCISAVESVGHWTDSDMGLPLTDGIDEMWIAKGNAIAALRALEEKP